MENAVIGERIVRKTSRYSQSFYEVIGESYGRILFIVIQPLGRGLFRVISARDATNNEKRIYKKRRK